MKVVTTILQVRVEDHTTETVLWWNATWFLRVPSVGDGLVLKGRTISWRKWKASQKRMLMLAIHMAQPSNVSAENNNNKKVHDRGRLEIRRTAVKKRMDLNVDGLNELKVAAT